MSAASIPLPTPVASLSASFLSVALSPLPLPNYDFTAGSLLDPYTGIGNPPAKFYLVETQNGRKKPFVVSRSAQDTSGATNHLRIDCSKDAIDKANAAGVPIIFLDVSQDKIKDTIEQNQDLFTLLIKSVGHLDSALNVHAIEYDAENKIEFLKTEFKNSEARSIAAKNAANTELSQLTKLLTEAEAKIKLLEGNAASGNTQQSTIIADLQKKIAELKGEMKTLESEKNNEITNLQNEVKKKSREYKLLGKQFEAVQEQLKTLQINATPAANSVGNGTSPVGLASVQPQAQTGASGNPPDSERRKQFFEKLRQWSEQYPDDELSITSIKRQFFPLLGLNADGILEKDTLLQTLYDKLNDIKPLEETEKELLRKTVYKKVNPLPAYIAPAAAAAAAAAPSAAPAPAPTPVSVPVNPGGTSAPAAAPASTPATRGQAPSKSEQRKEVLDLIKDYRSDNPNKIISKSTIIKKYLRILDVRGRSNIKDDAVARETLYKTLDSIDALKPEEKALLIETVFQGVSPLPSYISTPISANPVDGASKTDNDGSTSTNNNSGGGGILNTLASSVASMLGGGSNQQPASPANPADGAGTNAAASNDDESKSANNTAETPAPSPSYNFEVINAESPDSDEQKIIDDVWKHQIPYIPLQQYGDWVKAKNKNPKITVEEFAGGYKENFVKYGYIFYENTEQDGIVVSANVDESGDDMEVYNLLSTSKDKKLVPAFVNFIADYFKNKKLIYRPANRKLKKLYDDWQTDGKIYDSNRIVIQDADNKEAPYDFRFNKAADLKNPVWIPMFFSQAKNLPNKKSLYLKWKKEYYKRKDGKYIQLSENEVDEKVWRKDGYYDKDNIADINDINAN